MTTLTHPVAQTLHRAGHWPRLATARVVLGYDERFLRRKRLITAAGRRLSGRSGRDDQPDWRAMRFELTDGRLIEVAAAEEPVLVITGDLARLAWHIGNRHTPCQIEADRLVIRARSCAGGDAARVLAPRSRAPVNPSRPKAAPMVMGARWAMITDPATGGCVHSAHRHGDAGHVRARA